MRIYIDLETIPTQRPELKERIIQDIKCPGNISKLETIEKWERETKPLVIDEKYRATALNGTFGEITHIGWAFDDEEPQCLYRNLNGSESTLLHNFFQSIQEKINSKRTKTQNLTWIGHNCTNFDLRFLWQRCVINRCKPAIKIPYNAKPWDSNIFDTYYEWAGLHGKDGSLDKICLALGYKGKGTLDGSKVWDYVLAGRHEEVAKYCKDDVIKARLIHKDMTFSF